MPDKSQLIREVFAALSKPGATVLITVDGHGAPYRVRVSIHGGLLECFDSLDRIAEYGCGVCRKPAPWWWPWWPLRESDARLRKRILKHYKKLGNTGD